MPLIRFEDETVAPLVDDDQSVNHCVWFVLHRFESLLYD
jgi:hypothetical protein